MVAPRMAWETPRRPSRLEELRLPALLPERPQRRQHRLWPIAVAAFPALLTLLLSACGGGGGGSAAATDSSAAAPPALSSQCSSGSVARLAYDSAPVVGQTTEISLLSCNASALRNPRWTQTGGPSLTLLSARSPALSLELPTAGSYRFSISYSDASGRALSGELSLEARAPASASAPSLNLRGEPSVWGGGSLSLRAWPQGLSATELAGARYAWSQLDGPSAVLGSADSAQLIFSAPRVTQDSLLRLRATVTLADGRSLADEFSLLVQPPPNPAAQPLFDADNPSSRVYPYLAEGPHASALADCIYHPGLSSSPNNLCTLGRLPLLGQQTSGAAPSIEQVMQRVLVSHDWMGEVFERFLREQDPHGDFRRMLASTTAVVIGARVRPAFYWSATGAIYLDAAYLWLTPAQRDTLSEAPDPRSAYGSTLSYSTPWRYVLDNRYATRSWPIAERQSRELAELRYELGRLLYHELTHAADFLPPRLHATLPTTLRVYEAVPANTPSQTLQQQLPFLSQEMVALGRVQYFGVAPTAALEAYTPDDVLRFFSNDRVTDDYSYSLPVGASVPREDAAMLMEEAMMQLRYGVQRDFAITPRLQDGAASADLILRWGQRGRIGDAAIKPRLALILPELMPWVDSRLIEQLPTPLALRAGLSWGQNLDQSAIAAGSPRALSATERAADAALMDQQFGRQEQARRAKAARLRGLDLSAR